MCSTDLSRLSQSSRNKSDRARAGGRSGEKSALGRIEIVEILSVSNHGLGFRAPRRAHFCPRAFFSARQRKRYLRRRLPPPLLRKSGSERSRRVEPALFFTAAYANLSTARKRILLFSSPSGQPRRVRNFEADEPSSSMKLVVCRTRRPMTSIVCGLSSCRFIPRSIWIV